jgi:hypothetical protein
VHEAELTVSSFKILAKICESRLEVVHWQAVSLNISAILEVGKPAAVLGAELFPNDQPDSQSTGQFGNRSIDSLAHLPEIGMRSNTKSSLPGRNRHSLGVYKYTYDRQRSELMLAVASVPFDSDAYESSWLRITLCLLTSSTGGKSIRKNTHSRGRNKPQPLT